MNKKEIARMIDHTLLKPATAQQISDLCEEAKKYNFASVCVNPCHVKLAAQLLDGSGVKVCTVIGFPLGENTTELKVAETKIAIADGATEIDMVMNQSWAKSGDWDKIRDEIAEIKRACGNLILKVILETCNLTDEQIVAACKASVDGGANFVKTSTGFGKGGATVHAVSIMHECVAPYGLKVKASGGVHNFDEAKAMIDAGASRIGASCGVEICKE